MIEQVSARDIERLRWAYSAAWVSIAAALFVAAVIDGNDRGGELSWWFGVAVVGAIGAFVLFVVRYYRHRPLQDARFRAYAATVLFRTGASLVPAALGLVFAIATGRWWVALVGVAIAGAGLAWSAPGEKDYARHRGLATEVPPMPSDGTWGAAPDGEAAPWEDERGGHGHGLVDY